MKGRGYMLKLNTGITDELDRRLEGLIGTEVSNRIDELLAEVAKHAPAELVQSLEEAICDEKFANIENSFLLGIEFQRDPAGWLFEEVISE